MLVQTVGWEGTVAGVVRLAKRRLARSPTGGGAQPSSGAVRSQLERLLNSPEFKASERRKSLLRYVVEEALAGRADRLKGYSIGLAVFDRDEDFDPQSDPVVRLEASRLRQDLEHYYLTAGRGDPLMFEIPKGGYAPTFQSLPVTSEGESPPDRDEKRLAGGARYRGLRGGAIVAAVLLVAGGIAWTWLEPRFVWRASETNQAASDGQRSPTTPARGATIAVMPLVNLSGDSDADNLPDAIADQVVMDLYRFKELTVIPLTTTNKYKGQDYDPSSIKRELGVSYYVEGSARRTESTIKVNVRLVDTGLGNVVWAETYTRELQPGKIFEMQDEISRQLAAILGSRYGVIARMDLASMRGKPPASFDAYRCVLQYYRYNKSINPEGHGRIRACLEEAVKLEPDYWEAWAVLSNVYSQETRFDFNPRPWLYDPLARALEAAKRAVELNPSNPRAQLMLGNVYHILHDLDGFKAASDRAIALNPNNPDLLAHYGMRLALSGDWARGLAMMDKATALNPDHPSWYRFSRLVYHYTQRDYERALLEAREIDMPDFFWNDATMAMILGQLGRIEEARPVAQKLLQVKPDIRERFWHLTASWNLPCDVAEHIADGLRKAGIEIEPAPVKS